MRKGQEYGQGSVYGLVHRVEKGENESENGDIMFGGSSGNTVYRGL